MLSNTYHINHLRRGFLVAKLIPHFLYINQKRGTYRMPAQKRALPFFDQSLIESQKRQDSKNSSISSINYRENLTLLINNEGYNFFMAVVTVYSIFAIDFVKSFSGQQTAYVFGYIHIVAITLFTLQMVLNVILKEKYVLSFYFWIDCVSTVSMVMEITWVDNWLADNSSLPAILTLAKVVKASRLSRIGGRAAKILLIFITYFKKKNQEEQELKIKEATKNTESVVGDSQFKTQTFIENKGKSEVDVQEEIKDYEFYQQAPKKLEIKNRELEPISQEIISQRSNESEDNTDRNKRSVRGKTTASLHLLGKKRSKMAKSSQKHPNSPAVPRKTFQITNIVERLEQTFKLQPLVRANIDKAKAAELELKWQELLEREQKAKNESKQKIKSNKENFKLGQTLKEQIQKNIIIMIMSLIIILPLISADTWFNNDPTIDQMMDNYIAIADNQTDPSLSYYFIRQVITSSFSMSSPIIYLNVQIGNTTYIYPDQFPDLLQPSAPLNDFMEVQKIFANGNGYDIIFNDRGNSRISSIINILRSCFITLLLIFSTIIFMYSIQIHALIPLESMCISINKISINPFDALKNVNQKKGEQSFQKNDLETIVLQKSIWKMTSLLVIGAGEQGSQLIESKIDENHMKSSSFRFIEGKKIHGIFMYIKISNFQQIFDKYNKDILPYINRITSQIHQIVIKNGGNILENDCPFFLGFWKTPQDLNIQLETTKYFSANNPLKNLGKTIQTQKFIQLVLRTYLQINMALLYFSKRKLEETIKDSEDLFEDYIIQAGIHIGDGFSGSIGSNLKLEIKCVGKDVEYTKNLCKLAGSYEVSNILSEEICDILDDHEPNFIRKMDYIKESKYGSMAWLYTFDFSLLPLIYPERYQTHIRLKKRKTSKMKSFSHKHDRNALYRKRSEILSRIKNQPIQSVIPLHNQQKNCQKMFTFEFYNTWNAALEKYYSGEWQQALTIFEIMKDYYQMSYNDRLSVMMMERIKSQGGIDLQKWDKAKFIYFE